MLERLKDLICVQKRSNTTDISSYLKNLIEIEELKFICVYYMLNDHYEFQDEILKLNKKYRITLDPIYLSKRWEKFYSRRENKKFDDRIKEYVFNRDGKKCSYCGYNKEIQIHHVVPREQKGPNSKYNLVTVCRKCNISIGTNIKIPLNWWSLHPDSQNR